MAYFYEDILESFPNNSKSINVSSNTFTGLKKTAKTTIPYVMTHNHKSIEILLVADGLLNVKIGDTEYALSKGDFVLCNPYDVHSIAWINDGNNHGYICLTLSPQKFNHSTHFKLTDSFKLLMSGAFKFDSFYPAKNADTKEIVKHILNIRANFPFKSVTNECNCLASVYSIFSILFEFHFKESNDTKNHKGDIEFMSKISEYVIENYKSTITTAEVASIFFMSPSQFCHKFIKCFGTTFSEYLSSFRIEKAISLYTSSSRKITDIALEVGFNDYGYFSKKFKKKVGIPPSIYFSDKKQTL